MTSATPNTAIRLHQKAKSIQYQRRWARRPRVHVVFFEVTEKHQLEPLLEKKLKTKGDDGNGARLTSDHATRAGTVKHLASNLCAVTNPPK